MLTYADVCCAVDKHTDATCPASGTKTACTCRSLPLCVKIKIVGAAPVFVAPTPLEANSRDDAGNLVKGRTDVPACEGYGLTLPLVAQVKLLTYADVCGRMRTYSDVCGRILTYAVQDVDAMDLNKAHDVC